MKHFETKIVRLTLWIGFLTTFSSGQQPPSTARPGFSAPSVSIEAVPDFISPRTIAYVSPACDTESVETGYEGCPLTLFLIINVAPGGALRYLETPRGRRLSDEPETPENVRTEVIRETDEDFEC